MSDACNNCGMHDGQHISNCYYATDKQYIHQLEGWLAQVRERSAKLLEERNTLVAELAALKGRQCEGCAYQEHWPKEGPSRLSEMPLACTSCFGTSRWTAEEATS